MVHSLKLPLCLQIKILIYYLDVTGPLLSASSINCLLTVAHKLTLEPVFHHTTLYPLQWTLSILLNTFFMTPYICSWKSVTEMPLSPENLYYFFKTKYILHETFFIFLQRSLNCSNLLIAFQQ